MILAFNWCHFSHQIPKSVLVSPTTIQAAEQFIPQVHQKQSSRTVTKTTALNDDILEDSSATKSSKVNPINIVKDVVPPVTHNINNPTSNVEDISVVNAHNNVTGTHEPTDSCESEQQQYQQNVHNHQELNPNTPSYVSYPVNNNSQIPISYYNPYQQPSMAYNPFLFLVRQMIQNQIHQLPQHSSIQQQF